MDFQALVKPAEHEDSKTMWHLTTLSYILYTDIP